VNKALLLRVGGGLCNRLRALLSAEEWALSENRQLLVAWPTSVEFEAGLEDLVADPVRSVPPKAVSLAARAFGGYRTAENLDVAPKRAVLVASTANVVVRDGRWIEWGPRLRALRPSRQVQERVDSMALPAGRVVGVMIRADQRSHRFTLAASPPEWYFQRMESFRSDDPDVRFFLSTDSPQVSADVHSRFPGTLEQNDKGRYNSRDAIVGAMADIYLLARTTYILGAHFSSFSETAALLSGHGGYETSRLQPLESWEERRASFGASATTWPVDVVSASLYFPNDGPPAEQS
jgi:hypothetical protein